MEYDGRADTESLDERKQTEVVRVSDWPRPHKFPPVPGGETDVCREGMVRVGGGCDIPRVAGHGERKEGEDVVDEIGDNHFHELLGKRGDWGRAQCSHL